MRSRACVSMLALLCGIGVGARAMSSTQHVQTAPQSVKAEQITSQPGQQLFPTVSPDRTVAYSQRYGSDWDVYVLRHAAPPVNLTADSAADDWQAEIFAGRQVAGVSFRESRRRNLHHGSR